MGLWLELAAPSTFGAPFNLRLPLFFRTPVRNPFEKFLGIPLSEGAADTILVFDEFNEDWI